MDKRYRVYEQVDGGLNTVLQTDCLDEAKAKYKTCWGYPMLGGIWDNATPKGKYGWVG